MKKEEFETVIDNVATQNVKFNPVSAQRLQKKNMIDNLLGSGRRKIESHDQ